MNHALTKWLYQALQSVIQGGATTVLAILGINGSAAAGIPIAALQWKQMAGIFVAGCVVNLLLYLKSTSLPPLDTDEAFFKRMMDEHKQQPLLATTRNSTEFLATMKIAADNVADLPRV